MDQIKQFQVSRSLQTNREKKQQGAQQLVLLVEVCLETHPSTATPTPSTHSQSRTVSLVCLTCPRGGTATPTPPAHDQSPPGPLVYLTCPKRWHDRGDRRLTKHHPHCWGSGCPFSPTHLPAPITTPQCTKWDRTVFYILLLRDTSADNIPVTMNSFSRSYDVERTQKLANNKQQFHVTHCISPLTHSSGQW